MGFWSGGYQANAFWRRSSETTEGESSGEESDLVSSELAVESSESLSESRLAALS